MAIRKIRKNEDEVLRKKSKEIGNINDKIKTLVKDMVETMYEYDGVGLAAPQVGMLKRVVVIDVNDEKGLLELINPEIVHTEGEQCETEGCLSVPGVWEQVKRPAKVVAKALNLKGEEITIEGTGLLAVALCHEIDHLDGILFIDKAVKLKK